MSDAQELLYKATKGDSCPAHEYSSGQYISTIELDGTFNTIEFHAPTQDEAEAIRDLVFEAIENQSNTFTL